MPVETSSGLLIPDNALDATGEYLSPAEAARHCVEAAWFRKLLKSVDPRLDLIFVKPGSKVFEHSPRFYITRRSENAHDQYWVIQDREGNYCVPTQEHFDRFQSGDAAKRPSLWKEYEANREARVERARKHKEELRREFREKLTERLDHIYDPARVLITGSHKQKLEGSKDAGLGQG